MIVYAILGYSFILFIYWLINRSSHNQLPKESNQNLPPLFEEKQNDMVLSYLEKIVFENLNTVYKVFMKTLAIDLTGRFGTGVDSDKVKWKYIEQYEENTYRVISEAKYTRRDYPRRPPRKYDNRKLESISTDLTTTLQAMSIDDAISFLSELTGAWILSCPKQIVRSDYFLLTGRSSRDTEAFIIETLKKYLHESIDLGR